MVAGPGESEGPDGACPCVFQDDRALGGRGAGGYDIVDKGDDKPIEAWPAISEGTSHIHPTLTQAPAHLAVSLADAGQALTRRRPPGALGKQFGLIEAAFFHARSVKRNWKVTIDGKADVQVTHKCTHGWSDGAVAAVFQGVHEPARRVGHFESGADAFELVHVEATRAVARPGPLGRAERTAPGTACPLHLRGAVRAEHYVEAPAAGAPQRVEQIHHPGERAAQHESEFSGGSKVRLATMDSWK